MHLIFYTLILHAMLKFYLLEIRKEIFCPHGRFIFLVPNEIQNQDKCNPLHFYSIGPGFLNIHRQCELKVKTCHFELEVESQSYWMRTQANSVASLFLSTGNEFQCKYQQTSDKLYI